MYSADRIIQIMESGGAEAFGPEAVLAMIVELVQELGGQSSAAAELHPNALMWYALALAVRRAERGY